MDLRIVWTAPALEDLEALVRYIAQDDGDVGYSPFRGPGHFQMQTTLKQRGSVECYFELDQRRVSFRVIECPKYGVLRIRELPPVS
jgi:hypothetical protein